MLKPIDDLLREIDQTTDRAGLNALSDYVNTHGRGYTLVELRRYKDHKDAKLAQLTVQFIDEHFPPAVIKTLKKSEFFKKGKLTHADIEARVCQFFGLTSIFDYAAIGEGTGVHLSLTKKGIEEGIEANFVMGQPGNQSTQTT